MKTASVANTTFGKIFSEEMQQSILDMIESSTAPWQKPWKNANGTSVMPCNAATGRRYNGANAVNLFLRAEFLGYKSYGWMTFNQAKKLGYSVMKGEKSTKVVFWSFRDKKDEDDDKKGAAFCSVYSVFNVAQLVDADGQPVTLCTPTAVEIPQAWDDVAYAEAIIQACGMTIHEVGKKAVYMPALDLIKVPERTSFDDAAGFYATIFHEMIHATMHKSRCNRVDAAGHAFGSKGYAAEELCAEQGAWMLALALGVPFEPQHSASYLSSWSEVFPTKEDKLFALNNSFKAASEALMWIEKKALEAGVLQHQESGESEQLEAA